MSKIIKKNDNFLLFIFSISPIFSPFLHSLFFFFFFWEVGGPPPLTLPPEFASQTTDTRNFYVETSFCAVGLFMRLPAIFNEIICHVSVGPPWHTVPRYHHFFRDKRRLAVRKSVRKMSYRCKQ